MYISLLLHYILIYFLFFLYISAPFILFLKFILVFTVVTMV